MIPGSDPRAPDTSQQCLSYVTTAARCRNYFTNIFSSSPLLQERDYFDLLVYKSTTYIVSCKYRACDNVMLEIIMLVACFCQLRHTLDNHRLGVVSAAT